MEITLRLHPVRAMHGVWEKSSTSRGMQYKGLGLRGLTV